MGFVAWPGGSRLLTSGERSSGRETSGSGQALSGAVNSPPVAPKADWEYIPEGWMRQNSDPAIKSLRMSPRLPIRTAVSGHRSVSAVEGPGPLGVAHDVPADIEVPRDERGAHHTIMTFVYALTLASRHSNRLSVLDWGGGPGHYYVLSRALLPGVEFEYYCKDVPHLVALGRELVPEVNFSSDQSCLNRQYDFVFASGSFQYAEDWRQTFADLAKAAAGLSVRHSSADRPASILVRRPATAVSLWLRYRVSRLGNRTPRAPG